MIVLLMGVSGSGKSTIGQLLAGRLGWPFYEGDDYHPPANIAKMQAHIPLTEADRVPWLAALHTLIDTLLAHGQPGIIACSALTAFDRQQLLRGDRDVQIIYLHGAYDLIRARLQARHGHFFKADMLDSQFATLQEPVADATVAEIDQPPQAIVQEIVDHLKKVAPDLLPS